MKNPEIDRLEAKLRLWDTPGFSQFVNDLSGMTPWGCTKEADRLKLMYLRQLEDLKEKESKFKQGKLDL
jgi:hypothetical protein